MSDEWIKDFEHLTPNPDVIVVPIEGFRLWYCPPEKPTLHSAVHCEIEWTPGKRMEALCLTHAACKAFGGGCTAGIYAFRTLDEAAELYYEFLDNLVAHAAYDEHVGLSPHSRVVIGRVYLWGKVLECENGFRGEYAYPSVIYDTAPNSYVLAEVYRVSLAPKPKGVSYYRFSPR